MLHATRSAHFILGVEWQPHGDYYWDIFKLVTTWIPINSQEYFVSIEPVLYRDKKPQNWISASMRFLGDFLSRT